jgi:hypothetical protein
MISYPDKYSSLIVNFVCSLEKNVAAAKEDNWYHSYHYHDFAADPPIYHEYTVKTRDVMVDCRLVVVLFEK